MYSCDRPWQHCLAVVCGGLELSLSLLTLHNLVVNDVMYSLAIDHPPE